MKSSQRYTTRITHLYPQRMNIYGDIGNIITLQKRCEWRGIRVLLQQVEIGDKLPSSTDIYFIGGGQDEDQLAVYKDLQTKKTQLTADVKDHVPFLAICGGYQLLGKYFLSGDGRRMKGLGIVDIETVAQSTQVKERCIGNVVAQLNPAVFDISAMQLDTIVGFENHSGQTYLGSGVEPLAHVRTGCGNNREDNYEGIVYHHVIGTYLHGSFLPKNPHIADWLIEKALETKHKKKVTLKKLPDKEELAAHKTILERFS